MSISNLAGDGASSQIRVDLGRVDATGDGRDCGISDAQLASFCCAYMICEHMLDRAHVVKGERVLVTGASGGVGSAIIQLSRARGAMPYALTRRRDAGELLKIGAEGTVSRSEQDNLLDKIGEATGGEPVDVIVDLAPDCMSNNLLLVLRPEGRYIIAGAVAGPPADRDLPTMDLKQLPLNGSSQGIRNALRRVRRYIDNGDVKPLLDRAYKRSDFDAVQQAFIDNNHVDDCSPTQTATRINNPSPDPG